MGRQKFQTMWNNRCQQTSGEWHTTLYVKHSEGIQTNMFVPTMQELFSPNAKLSADHQLMTSALVERGGRSDRRTALCQSLSLQLFPDILGCFEVKSTTGWSRLTPSIFQNIFAAALAVQWSEKFSYPKKVTSHFKLVLFEKTTEKMFLHKIKTALLSTSF